MKSGSPLISALGVMLCFGAEGGAMPTVAQDSLVYAVLPPSRLDVHTGTAGVLGGLGHEHLVRARAFHGTIVYVPVEPARSSVVITVLTDSLEVLTEASPEDVAKMTRAMREQTLKVDRFPEITFQSRGVEQLVGQTRGGGLRVIGELTMVGQTRPVTVDMTFRVTADTLTASGSFTVRQTDFGIRPYSTGLGMVKVADAVRFEINVVGRAVPTERDGGPREPQ